MFTKSLLFIGRKITLGTAGGHKRLVRVLTSCLIAMMEEIGLHTYQRAADPDALPRYLRIIVLCMQLGRQPMTGNAQTTRRRIGHTMFSLT
jgi:hypothetical protein